MISLVIGGARSGKSRFAQSLCMSSKRVVYLATARCEDAEMAARIERHRQDRPAHWLTVEAPLELAEAIECHSRRCEFILLDCLTLWLSNRFAGQRESSALDEWALAAAASAPCHLVVVTNELGCGLVPETELGRAFRDAQGWLNQAAAQSADFVYHLVAGIAVPIKGARP